MLSVEQVQAGRMVITHTCPCSGKEELKGRYIIVPDLMYRLFRDRMVRLPYYRLRRYHVADNHPDLIVLHDQLAAVKGLDDMFPPA